MKNVGTPYELSGLPRLYQEYVGHDNNRDAYMLNMIESRVHRAHVAAVGAADHLRAPSVGSVPDAHLAAAVLGAGRHRSAVRHLARSEHDRHGDREGTRGARAGRRHAHGHRVRRVVSRLRRLRAELQEHRGVLDRDRPLPVRDAARVHARRLPAEHARPAAAEPLLEPVASRLVATARRRRLHGNGVAVRARVRLEIQGVAAPQSLQSRTRSDRAADKRKRRSPTSSRRSSAIRWRPSSCCDGWRSAACAYSSSPTPSRSTATGTRPARGWCRPIRNSPRWRARSSTCRTIRTFASIRAVRPSVRTTPPAGRCRCRWASRSCRSRRR